MTHDPTTTPHPLTRPFHICSTCGKVRAPSDSPEMSRLLERHRYTVDNDDLTLHLWESEDDHAVTMCCGAHYTHQGVYLSPMQVPAPIAHRRATGEQDVDELTYHEVLLACLDRNTRDIVDALMDMTSRLVEYRGRDR